VSDAAAVVERLWTGMQAQDWDAVAACLAPTLVVRWPHTGERFGDRDAYLAANRGYPEGWSFAVQRLIGSGRDVASLVEIEHDDQVFHCAGFYEVEAGCIVRGVEYWMTAGGTLPPEWLRSPG
jgi:hypothetical protein